MEKLIFIGKTNELFVNGYPQKWENFKYLLIQESSEESVKMLLMKEGEPYKYHAEGLMSYMVDKNLSDIVVRGGGKIDFQPGGKEIGVLGKSYGFGTPAVHEIKEFIEQNWPHFTLVSIPAYGEPRIKTYSKAEVKYKADNP